MPVTRVEELQHDGSTPYSLQPEWADVTPLDANEGLPEVVAVQYEACDQETLGYFYAVLAKGELSARVLALTEEVSCRPFLCYRKSPGHVYQQASCLSAVPLAHRSSPSILQTTQPGTCGGGACRRSRQNSWRRKRASWKACWKPTPRTTSSGTIGVDMPFSGDPLMLLR